MLHRPKLTRGPDGRDARRQVVNNCDIEMNIDTPPQPQPVLLPQLEHV